MKTTQEMIAVETWKDIEGFNGRYQISNLGRIRNTNFHRSGTTKIMKQHSHSCGYKFIILRKNGKKVNFYVHRLVAVSFIDNPLNLTEIDHIDTDKTNNVVSNLRWVTHIENQNNILTKKKMIENNIPTGTGRCGKLHSRSKPIIQSDKDGNLIKEWESVNMAATELGLSYGNLYMCCVGKRSNCGGYLWTFK